MNDFDRHVAAALSLEHVAPPLDYPVPRGWAPLERPPKAADVPDVKFLAVVAEIKRVSGMWASWGVGGVIKRHGDSDIPWPGVNGYFPGVPHKVLVAKARKLIKRGLLDGVPLGRGDFELTAAGRRLLGGEDA